MTIIFYLLLVIFHPKVDYFSWGWFLLSILLNR